MATVTEIRVHGLKLGHNTPSIVTQDITVHFSCNWCRNTKTRLIPSGINGLYVCAKCPAPHIIRFKASILQRDSSVMGHLHLLNVSPQDVSLSGRFSVGCLNCSLETHVHDLTVGQTKELNCEHCQNNLSIKMEGATCNLCQPGSKSGPGIDPGFSKFITDHGFLEIRPDKGSCKHYRQSQRWLRCPCCSRAYSCDVCRDEYLDDPMNLASNMICGDCAKTQTSGPVEPCVACGSVMTRSSRNRQWKRRHSCHNQM